MRCWTTKDTPGLSPLDRKNGLAVFSQGWTMGIVALGVFSVILVKMKWWRISQPTKSKSRNGKNQELIFLRKKKKFQEARIELCVTIMKRSRCNYNLDGSTTENNELRMKQS